MAILQTILNIRAARPAYSHDTSCASATDDRPAYAHRYAYTVAECNRCGSAYDMAPSWEGGLVYQVRGAEFEGECCGCVRRGRGRIVDVTYCGACAERIA